MHNIVSSDHDCVKSFTKLVLSHVLETGEVLPLGCFTGGSQTH